MNLSHARKYIVGLICIALTMSGCMFQVSLESLDQAITDSVPPDLVGAIAPVDLIETYPSEGINVNFYSYVTAYIPTQQSYKSTNSAKWYWVKSIMSYLNLAKIFTTESGYRVLISSEDNLVEDITL